VLTKLLPSNEPLLNKVGGIHIKTKRHSRLATEELLRQCFA
jgi:hypothetical protein